MWKVSRRTMKRVSWLLACAVGLVVYAACTSHGEGGRCDPGNVPAGSNQNADCNDGLVCTPGSELALPDGGGHPQGYFCCPPDRSGLPITDICAGSPTSPGSDASIPDGALGDGSVTDSSSDQSTSDVVTTDGSDDGATDAADDAADAADE